MNWQPMKTAPKDGTYILAYWPAVFGVQNAATVTTWWGPRGHVSGVNNSWQSPFEWDDGFNSPTHWMPLPPPPTE